MCGVAGAFLQPDGKVVVNTMIDVLAHRGPDACGVLELVEPEHRRSTSPTGGCRSSTSRRRPTSRWPSEGLTLSYNGELYNYRELRDRARRRPGVRFATDSDTEVVLEAWRAWGTGGPGPLPRACSRSRSTTPPPAPSPWRVTRWASSRSTSCGAARAWCSPPSSRPSSPRSVRSCSVDPAGDGGLGALLLAAAAVRRAARGAQAAGGDVDGVPPRRVVASAGSTGTPPRSPPGPPRVRRWTCGRPSRRRSRRTSSRTCRSRHSSAAASTPASSRRWRTAATRRSRRTRSPSAPRTSAWRRCRTTRTTRGGWPPTSGSGCTRSRSRPDVVDLLPRMVDILDEPIGDPPRSTRC